MVKGDPHPDPLPEYRNFFDHRCKSLGLWSRRHGRDARVTDGAIRATGVPPVRAVPGPQRGRVIAAQEVTAMIEKVGVPGEGEQPAVIAMTLQPPPTHATAAPPADLAPGGEAPVCP